VNEHTMRVGFSAGASPLRPEASITVSPAGKRRAITSPRNASHSPGSTARPPGMRTPK
jgi:hypothetical protein